MYILSVKEILAFYPETLKTSELLLQQHDNRLWLVMHRINTLPQTCIPIQITGQKRFALYLEWKEAKRSIYTRLQQQKATLLYRLHLVYKHKDNEATLNYTRISAIMLDKDCFKGIVHQKIFACHLLSNSC